MLAYLPIFDYFILIAFLVSLILYFVKGGVSFYLKLFPPFLLLSLFAEVYGNYLSWEAMNNRLLYNIFTTVEYCFYLFILRELIRDQSIRKAMLAANFTYPVLALVNIFFVQGRNNFHSFTYSIGALLIVTGCVIYFLELFRRPTAVKLITLPPFWICSGLIFFYSVSFPLVAFSNFLQAWSPLILRNFYAILNILNIFLYTLFTIAFLCRIRARKYTS